MTKKQFLQASIYIFIFLILLRSVTYVIRTNGDIKDIFTGFYAQEKDTVDVVFIGSSSSYTYYAAPLIYGETGIACYPLSSNVQRPVAAIPLMEEAYKTQSPEVFVFEMRMYTMEDGTLESNTAFIRGVTDNMKYSLNRFRTVNRLVTDKTERYTYHFDIFKYHSNWKTMVLPDQLRCVIYEKENPLKGFVIRDDVTKLEPDRYPVSVEITDTMPIPAEQEERLRELLQYLKEHEQQALFIVSPYLATEDETKMFRYMEQIVEENGYTFVNFNDHLEEIGLDFETDFFDAGHVNTVGADKCSRFAGSLLMQYGIGDKRGTAGYESYDDAYQNYLELYDQTKQKIDRILADGTYHTLDEVREQEEAQ